MSRGWEGGPGPWTQPLIYPDPPSRSHAGPPPQLQTPRGRNDVCPCQRNEPSPRTESQPAWHQICVTPPTTTLASVLCAQQLVPHAPQASPPLVTMAQKMAQPHPSTKPETRGPPPRYGQLSPKLCPAPALSAQATPPCQLHHSHCGPPWLPDHPPKMRRRSLPVSPSRGLRTKCKPHRGATALVTPTPSLRPPPALSSGPAIARARVSRSKDLQYLSSSRKPALTTPTALGALLQALKSPADLRPCT